MMDIPPLNSFSGASEMACFQRAAKRQGLPVEILRAIRRVEGGTVGKYSRNTNGSLDLGPMQINTVNVRWIAQAAYGVATPKTIKETRWHLMNNVCANIEAGAWILANRIKESRDVWIGIGRYHSPNNPRLAQIYRDKVRRALYAEVMR